MLSKLDALGDAIAAVCPHVGVSVGTWADVGTWRIDFAQHATPQQRNAAQDVLAAFDLLSAVKADVSRQIDEEAERQRLRYITGGATKAMEYMEARDQAVAVLQMGEAAANALPNHGAAEFPVLSASVPIEAASLYAAAQLISARYEAYASKAGQIKAKVIQAKAAIVAAQTAAEAQAVVEAITWP